MRQEQIRLEETALQHGRTEQFAENVMAELCLMLGCLGVLSCFYSGVMSVLFFAVATGAILFLEGANHLSRQRMAMMILYGTGVVVMLILKMFSCYQGLLNFLNQWIYLYNQRFQQEVLGFRIIDSSVDISVIFFLVLLLVLAWILVKIVKDRQAFAAMGLVWLLWAVCAVFGLQCPILYLIAALFGGICLWIWKTGYRLSMGKGWMFLTMTGALTIACLTATVGYERLSAIDAFDQWVVRQYEEYRYGEDTLPRGMLKQASEMIGEEEKPTLQIESAQLGTMYLKGFVGGTFDGHQWSELSGAAYQGDAAGMLDWMRKSGMEIPYQMAEYQRLVQGKQEEYHEVSVTNLGAYRKYVYLPYELSRLQTTGTKVEKDWQVRSTKLRGIGTYGFQVLNEQAAVQVYQAAVSQVKNHESEAFQNAEQVYSAFVYQYYLEVPEEERELLLDKFFQKKVPEHISVGEATTDIRVILQGISDYRDHPQSYDGRDDFAEWFLSGDKSGNAAYFATTAVLAYRLAGIPARYVEGYYISDGQADEIQNSGQNHVLLSQADAHAWAEVYMQGEGWLPVEVTPGYYLAQYTTQQILGTPDSSIKMSQSEGNPKLEGSTTESLQQVKKPLPPPETIVRETMKVIGILVLLALVLWALHWVIRLQRVTRRRSYQAKYDNGSTETIARSTYDRIRRMLKLGGCDVSDRFPYETIAAVKEHFPQIEEAEYRNYLDLLEAAVFGEIEWSLAERITVRRFEESIANTIYESCGQWKRLIMKYVYVFV